MFILANNQIKSLNFSHRFYLIC